MFETYKPTESLSGIDWFPTETIRPMESLRDGGTTANWIPVEQVRPTESLYTFELLI